MICSRTLDCREVEFSGSDHDGGLGDEGVEVGAACPGQGGLRPLSSVQRSPLRSGSVRCSRRRIWYSGAGMGNGVELVEGDASIGQVAGYALDEGRRHVDAHGPNLCGHAFVCSQVLGQGGDGAGVLAVGDKHDFALIGIDGGGQIIMAAPAGGLVDCHSGQLREIGIAQGEIDIA